MYSEIAKDYQYEIGFAFFVANFGYSKSDYEALTPREKSFILKAHEDKTVSDTTALRNAVLNAIANFSRKRGKRFIELWKKKQKRLDKDIATMNLDVVKNLEQEHGKSWIKEIYKMNGMHMPERRSDT